MLTDAEYEAKLDEFNNLAGIVKMPPMPKLYIGAAKWKPDFMPDPRNVDKEGRSLDILELERQYQAKEVKPDVDYTRIGRSLTRNIYNYRTMAFLHVFGNSVVDWGDGYINTRDLSGTFSHIEMQGQVSLEPVAYGQELLNIMVGTDGAAVDIDDYMLGAQIFHGDIAGRLRYWNTFANDKSYDAVEKTWTKEAVRYFTNHSGGTITVREMGYVWTLSKLIARDLLSPALDVANHEILRGYYKFMLDFSAID